MNVLKKKAVAVGYICRQYTSHSNDRGIEITEATRGKSLFQSPLEVRPFSRLSDLS